MTTFDFASAFSDNPAKVSSALQAAIEESAFIRGGWMPRSELNTEQRTQQDAFNNSAPMFTLRGRFANDERRVCLWKALKQQTGGKLPWIWQQTGSCVGAGGGNMLMVHSAVEIAIKGDREEFKLPWWLYTYGRSRLKAGLRGQGEGSFGSAWAETLKEEGSFEADPSGFDTPDYNNSSGWLIQPASVEMLWSDGAKIPSKLVDLGRKHTVKSIARMRTADDVYEAIAGAKTPVTLASMFGFNGIPPVRGSKFPVRVAEWNGQWAHQMAILEVWDHPELNEILFWVQNQWGPTIHGSTPYADCSNGGFYITKRTLSRILADSYTECYTYGPYDGYPVRELDLSSAFL